MTVNARGLQCSQLGADNWVQSHDQINNLTITIPNFHTRAWYVKFKTLKLSTENCQIEPFDGEIYHYKINGG